MSRFFTHTYDACLWMRLSKWMRKVECYGVEWLLTVCSLWASLVLFHPPSNFAAYPSQFNFIGHIADEHIWAEIVLVAAGLKLIGLLMGLWFKSEPLIQGLSTGMRVVGLGFSAMFWTLMGASALAGNSDSLFGFLGLVAGFSAWWVLIRYPTTEWTKLKGID
jgi:hypothetical protein